MSQKDFKNTVKVRFCHHGTIWLARWSEEFIKQQLRTDPRFGYKGY